MNMIYIRIFIEEHTENKTNTYVFKLLRKCVCEKKEKKKICMFSPKTLKTILFLTVKS